MSKTHLEFDRRIFKFATALLLVAMVFRHAMFYLDFGYINTEMGFDQSFFGLILLPVTASFGCVFFWERSQVILTRIDLMRLLMIGGLPLLLAFKAQDVLSVFNYHVDTLARRPSFLILLPIVLSVVTSYIFNLRLMSLIVILILNIFAGDIFVVHYYTLFLTFAILQSQSLVKKYQKKWMSLFILAVGIFFLKTFEINRVGFALELFLAIGFVGSIFFLSSLFNNFTHFISNNKYIDQLSVFYFYLSQAVVFTLISTLKGKGLAFILIPLVFFTSLFVSFYLKRAEEIFFKMFKTGK